MNREERRRSKKENSDPTLNIKLSALSKKVMTPEIDWAMRQEINRQLLEADDRIALDIDTMVLWTLFSRWGFGAKRLKKFYQDMFEEHQRMRSYYEIDDLYPERAKLREIGVDVEAWQKELLGSLTG